MRTPVYKENSIIIKMNTKLKKEIDKSFSEMLSFLQFLISIDSQQRESLMHCPFGKGPARILSETIEYCEKRGFRVKNIDNIVGWAEFGEGDELIGIPVHLDIVPEGSGWNYNPFEGTIDNEILYGRGVCDNKGPVAIMIHVLLIIKKLYPRWGKRVRLIFGTNEETGMKCMQHYLDSKEEIPTYGFTPDAMYPIINGEKGRLHIIISKPFINKDIDIHGGSKENVVPSFCEIRFHDKLIKEAGISAHGSSPEKGENAIMKALNELTEKQLESCEELNSLYKYFGKEYDGKALGIDSFDELFKKTTVNLGVVKTEKEEISAELDIRYGKTIQEVEIISKIRECFPSWHVIVKERKSLHYVEEDTYIVQMLKSSFSKTTGKKATVSTMGGGTYASCFPNMVAYGPKFPDVKTGGHGPNEHMSLKDIGFNMEIYLNTMLDLLEL